MAVFDDLAGNRTYGGDTPHQLFAGEGEIKTTYRTFAAGYVIEKYQPVALSSGKLVPWTTGTAFGIAAQPVDAYDADVEGPIFVSGVFNHEALVWPLATDTLAERQAAFDGTEILIQQLYG